MNRNGRSVSVDDGCCPQCGKKFERRDDRDRHIREHHGNGHKVTCPFCKSRVKPFLQRSGHRHLKTERCRQRRKELGIKLTDSRAVKFDPVPSGNAMGERLDNVSAVQEEPADMFMQLLTSGSDPFLFENLQEADGESDENDSLLNLDLENVDLDDMDVMEFIEL